jgi:hypothetical protein
MIEKEVMSTIAQFQSQLEKQPDLPLLDEDTTNFLDTESMGTTSADLFSDIYSAYAEPKFETHEDAQNALYVAACVRASPTIRPERRVWSRHLQPWRCTSKRPRKWRRKMRQRSLTFDKRRTP